MTELGDIAHLDITSVTDLNSLFLYTVNNDASGRVPVAAFNSSVFGGIKHFATVGRPGVALTKDVWHTQSWTITRSDAFGLLDPSSGNLFRIPDDTITHAQVMAQGNVREYLGSNGPMKMRINAGGLPHDYNIAEGWENWTGIVMVHNVQVITPKLEVQSGAHFWCDVQHSHSADRDFAEIEANVFFSIWCW